MKSGRVARLWMTVAGLVALAGWLLTGIAGAAWAESEPVKTPAAVPENGCAEVVFGGARFVACRFDVRRHQVRTFLVDEKGAVFGTLWRLDDWLKARRLRLLMAMNGGMFTEAQQPAGLYVEGGREVKGINLRRGRGNFHLMPNGVFWVRGQRAGVMESRRFARLYRRGRLKPDFATQSGPMLVIDGRLHPRFRAASDSLKIRNGVGVRRKGREVVFAISLDRVNFHTFARLFRDGFGVRNALFLDGSVSRLRTPEMSIGGFFGGGIGPIVAVVEKEGDRSAEKKGGEVAQ